MMSTLYQDALVDNQFMKENSFCDQSDGKQSAPKHRVPFSNISNQASSRSHPPVKKLRKSEKSPKSRKTRQVEEDPYVVDIFSYMHKKECEVYISPYYMTNQPDLKPTMRSILIDWMIQACIKFKLADDTQYYAIQYVDRYLSKRRIDRNSLQLVGICGIFLAAKFEEVLVPSMSDLCYITEDTYTCKVMLKLIYKCILY